MTFKSNQDTSARWINYIHSRQAGNCENGSRAWSSAVAYYISQKLAFNGNDARAWEAVAHQLQHATESNPILSVNLELCDRIMNDVAEDDSIYEHECAHECDDECDDNGCWHECDDGCYSRNSYMAQSIHTLRDYSSEWSRAYEFASEDNFIRALNIPERLHGLADQVSATTYGNHNAVISGYRDREAYIASGISRLLPRIDFGNLLPDSFSLDSLVFMAMFAPDQFESYAQLSSMSLTPMPSVSMLAFRRDPVKHLSFFENVDGNVATFANENEDTYRKAYAYYMTSFARDHIREHATNTLYGYDTMLHHNVTTYQLTELFNSVRYNGSTSNVLNALARLCQYAFSEKDNVRYVTSVSYYPHLADAIANRLRYTDVASLTSERVTDIVSNLYYWREIHNAAWQAYKLAMRQRYTEIYAKVDTTNA